MIMDKDQWITNKEVKQDVYKLTYRHDAVLTGRHTVELDDPQYTTLHSRWKKPYKSNIGLSLGIFDIPFNNQKFKNTTFGYILKIQI